MKSFLLLIVYTGIFLILICCTSVPKDLSSATSDFSDSFNGQVLLVDNGLDLYSNSFGNIEYKSPKYRIGSVSKTFISASIAMLIDKQKLSYSQTIERYVPELKNANKITIGSLVEHCSGLSDFSGKEYYDLLSRSIKKEELLNMVITKNENSTPNKKYYYSSMNYILLGIIIEEISQQDIISFLKQNIFDPLNMMNTGYEEYDFSVVDLIPGECILDADKYENYQMNYSSLMYSGGLYSTIDDLRKWCLEFSNPTVLPKWYIKNPKGWINEKKYNRDVQYHFGNLPAYSALVMIIKDSSNSFYIVLSNQGNNRMNPSIRKLPEFIFTKKT